MKETKGIAMMYATKITLDQHVMKHRLLTSIYKRQKKSAFLTEINVTAGIVLIINKDLVSVHHLLVVDLATHANLIVLTMAIQDV